MRNLKTFVANMVVAHELSNLGPLNKVGQYKEIIDHFKKWLERCLMFIVLNKACYIEIVYLLKKLKRKTLWALAWRKPKIGYFKDFGCKCFVLNAKIICTNSTQNFMKEFFLVIQETTLVVKESIHGVSMYLLYHVKLWRFYKTINWITNSVKSRDKWGKHQPEDADLNIPKDVRINKNHPKEQLIVDIKKVWVLILHLEMLVQICIYFSNWTKNLNL